MKSYRTGLSEFSLAVRESTIKRLNQVPAGMENWKISPNAMSFADTAQHLIDTDDWLFKKIIRKTIPPIKGVAGSVIILRNDEYKDLIGKLYKSGENRTALINGLTEEQLNELIYDERFGKEVTVWWIIVRGNLDHEIHHRGAVAAALRVLKDLKNL
jgi:uncharacterized damage-inducible protein DinB